MAEKTESNPRGAGRRKIDPQLKKVNSGVKIQQWMVDWLREYSKLTGESQATIIERALMNTYYLQIGPCII